MRSASAGPFLLAVALAACGSHGASAPAAPALTGDNVLALSVNGAHCAGTVAYPNLQVGTKAQSFQKLGCFVTDAEIELIGVGADAGHQTHTLSLGPWNQKPDHQHESRDV